MMKPEENRSEIEELLAQERLEAAEARQIITEIEAGDALLDEWGGGELPDAVRGRVNTAVAARLRSRERRHLLWRVAAVLAVGLAVFTMIERRSGRELEQPRQIASVDRDDATGAQRQQIISAEERELWELALLQDDPDYAGYGMDELGLAELMILFDEAELGMDETIGKDVYYENVIA